jgi:hypothetical protein
MQTTWTRGHVDIAEPQARLAVVFHIGVTARAPTFSGPPPRRWSERARICSFRL